MYHTIKLGILISIYIGFYGDIYEMYYTIKFGILISIYIGFYGDI